MSEAVLIFGAGNTSRLHEIDGTLYGCSQFNSQCIVMLLVVSGMLKIFSSSSFAVWAVVAAFGAAGTGFAASPFEEAKAAYERGEDATALNLFRPLAEQGDPAAQFWLGAMYDLGRGVPKDFGTAALWYRRAAEQGNPMAQHNLATMYEQGQGVSAEYALAAAIAWYRRAADQGYAPSQGNLGVLYAEGRGVKRDDVQAYKWFTLGRVAVNRSFIAARMLPEQVVEGDRLVSEFVAKPER